MYIIYVHWEVVATQWFVFAASLPFPGLPNQLPQILGPV